MISQISSVAMMRVVLLVALGLVSAAQGCRSAIDLIKEGEGFRSCMYRDTRGYRTICYGFNLDKSGASSVVSGAGGDFNSALNGGCLSQTVCDRLLQREVDVAARDAAGIFGNQCGCIQAVLTDLTYNLGAAGMRGFPNFISAIKAGRWADASYHLGDSAYCRQVGGRCTRNRNIISRGCSGFMLLDTVDEQDAELQQWNGGINVQAPQGGNPTFSGNVGYQGNGWNANGGVTYNPSQGGSPGYNIGFQWGRFQAEEEDAELQQWNGGFNVNAPQGGRPTFDGNLGYQGNGWSANGGVTYNPSQGGRPGYNLGFQFGRFQALEDSNAGRLSRPCIQVCTRSMPPVCRCVANPLSLNEVDEEAELQQWGGNFGISAPQGGSPTFSGSGSYTGNNWSGNLGGSYNSQSGWGVNGGASGTFNGGSGTWNVGGNYNQGGNWGVGASVGLRWLQAQEEAELQSCAAQCGTNNRCRSRCNLYGPYKL